MILEELLGKIRNSDRVIIREEDGAELFRGYAANQKYKEVSGTRRVKEVSLETEIFRRSKPPAHWQHVCLGERVAAEGISSFSFTDLQMLIYTRITLETAREGAAAGE